MADLMAQVLGWLVFSGFVAVLAWPVIECRVDDRRAMVRNLSRRADEQHNALMSGDLLVGTYGDYPPADLDTIPAVEALRHKLESVDFNEAMRAEHQRLLFLSNMETCQLLLKEEQGKSTPMRWVLDDGLWRYYPEES